MRKNWRHIKLSVFFLVVAIASFGNYNHALKLFPRISSALYYVAIDDSIKIIDSTKFYADESCFAHLKTGNKFPAIFVYDTLGNKINSDALFKNNRPVVFVTGSYSCPSFRKNAKRLNKFDKTNNDTCDVYVVYLQEAHPKIGSPYGGLLDNFVLNKKQKIKFKKAKHIEERIYYANKLRKDFDLLPNILIDNENNDFFWKVYSAPNGYLYFSAKGELITQRKWYYLSKHNMRKRVRHQKRAKRKLKAG